MWKYVRVNHFASLLVGLLINGQFFPSFLCVHRWTAVTHKGRLFLLLFDMAGRLSVQPMAHRRSASEEALSVACGAFQVCGFSQLPKHLVPFWGSICSCFFIRI